MQSLTWYTQRLRTMSSAEILWRLRSAARDFLDRYRLNFQMYPSPSDVCRRAGSANSYGFEVSRGLDAVGGTEIPADWKQTLIRQAERVVAHRLSFFNLSDVFLGDPIDWNRDHAHGKQAPMGYSPSIDYRDFCLTGDCKLVWEPNRHHHLVVLGRAYRATGNRRYAVEAVAQMQSWMDQCPFGKGMNWRSPLELGIRLINWVWTIDLIRGSGLVAGEFRSRLLHAVYLHLWEITRKYSRGSSANNHLVGEAAGVFVACAFFNEMPNAGKWMEESRRLLSREIFAQTYDDGCTREQALGYHFFVLQFFFIAGLVARTTGQEFSEDYWRRLEKMFAFAAAMLEGGENAPMFGDCDDGYVLDLGGRAEGIRPWLGVAAIVFKRSDFKALATEFPEPALWLLGGDSRRIFDSIPSTSAPCLRSRRFIDSGYYLLQCEASSDGRPAVSVLFDCGELGYTSIAAHGHADALSFALRVNGKDVFVDPGTYDYFTYPEWRTYFRSTRAHNTVTVDNQDQSVMLGPFMWGHRADSRCIEWDPWPDGGGKIVAEHGGYLRLRDPVVHRRSIELDPKARSVTIFDEIVAAANHHLAICFHLAEHCRASSDSAGTFRISLPEGELTLTVDLRLNATLIEGNEPFKGGWVSRGYHRKAPAFTLVAEGECRGHDKFRSVITMGSGKL
jgi:hypothetical protein